MDIRYYFYILFRKTIKYYYQFLLHKNYYFFLVYNSLVIITLIDEWVINGSPKIFYYNADFFQKFTFKHIF